MSSNNQPDVSHVLPVASQPDNEPRISRSKPWIFVLFVVIGQAVIMLANPDMAGGDITEWSMLGLLLGSMFGNAFVTGLWTVFGPMGFWSRVLLSLGWIILSQMSLVLNFSLNSSLNRRSEDVAVTAACMLTIWTLCQSLWLVRLLLNVQVASSSTDVGANATSQFSIRSLLGLMLATACVLTSAKYGLSHVDMDGVYRELAVFVFLGVAAFVLNLPVYLSCLWPSRHYKIALLFAFLLIGLISIIESSLFDLLGSGEAPAGALLAINLVQAVWVTLFFLTLRSYGYCLRIGRS